MPNRAGYLALEHIKPPLHSDIQDLHAGPTLVPQADAISDAQFTSQLCCRTDTTQKDQCTDLVDLVCM
jgi:hypothetical protein